MVTSNQAKRAFYVLAWSYCTTINALISFILNQSKYHGVDLDLSHRRRVLIRAIDVLYAMRDDLGKLLNEPEVKSENVSEDKKEASDVL